MSSYRLKFKYNDDIVIDAVSNELSSDLTIPSGGYSDGAVYYDYSSDPEDPLAVTVAVNRYAGTPNTDTQNFYRLSTQLELNDEYIIDEEQGIRMLVYFHHYTYDGHDYHDFIIKTLEKFCGIDTNDQEVWTNIWNSGAPSVQLSWDSTDSQEGYFALYTGIVTDKYGYYPDTPSVGIQLIVQKIGVFESGSNTTFWQDTVFVPIYDYSGSYLPTTGNIRIGGTGDGSYPSDPAERPDVANLNRYFSFGSTNGKGLTYYSVLVPDVYEIFSKIYGNSYINLETRLKSMIDFFRIPFTSTAGSNLTQIPVADVEVTVTNGMAPITSRFVEINFGVFSLENYGWDDWNDFKNTRATLYLPFHGRVEIDINAIARGTIEIVAVCDTYTGNVVYWVYTTSMQAPREVLYGMYEGQSAVQIPVANTYTPNQLGKMATGVATFGVGAVAAATGNFTAAAAAAFGMIAQSPGAHERSVDRSHIQDSSCAANSPLHIRLDIERREMLRTEQYREFAGIPAFVTKTLGELQGFVRVHSADYSGLKCEQSEKEIIKQMLENGVYV